MTYVEPTDLLQWPGARELAEVATPESRPIIPAELMALTITGGDRSQYDAEQQADADEALDRIQTEIANTTQIMDGYLGQRYALPLDPVPSILRACAKDIVRYRLHKDLQHDEKSAVYRRYKDAIKLLEQVRDGAMSLGIGDPQPAGGQVKISSGPRQFDRAGLADFGA
jgi:phage gp36-like protein